MPALWRLQPDLRGLPTEQAACLCTLTTRFIAVTRNNRIPNPSRVMNHTLKRPLDSFLELRKVSGSG